MPKSVCRDQSRALIAFTSEAETESQLKAVLLASRLNETQHLGPVHSSDPDSSAGRRMPAARRAPLEVDAPRFGDACHPRAHGEQEREVREGDVQLGGAVE